MCFSETKCEDVNLRAGLADLHPWLSDWFVMDVQTSYRHRRRLCGHLGHVSRSYSLSDDVSVMACFDLEAAIVGPEVDRDPDAGYAALVDLFGVSTSSDES